MKEFVDEDAGELDPGAVEGDTPFAEKGAGVDRAVAVAKSAGGVEPDGRSGEWGHPFEQRGGLPFVGKVLEDEKGGSRHSYPQSTAFPPGKCVRS